MTCTSISICNVHTPHILLRAAVRAYFSRHQQALQAAQGAVRLHLHRHQHHKVGRQGERVLLYFGRGWVFVCCLCRYKLSSRGAERGPINCWNGLNVHDQECFTESGWMQEGALLGSAATS
jgi:hypothetical protein